MNTNELLEELKQRFGAERIAPDDEEFRFLDERDLLFEECCWDFNAFIKYYQLIKQYGLEDRCLEVLAWKIEHFLSTDEITALQKTSFFWKFGKQQIIQNAFLTGTDPGVQ